MKGFYVYVKNELLEPKHIVAMDASVWLYLWFLDKMTVIDHEKGEGKVLGGKPIQYEEVKKDLSISRRTYTRWIDLLRAEGYIKTLRTPYGLCITVFKAFKVFGQKPNKKRCAAKGTSDIPSKAHLSSFGGTSNKTIQRRDNTEEGDFSFLKKKKEFYKKMGWTR